MDLKEEAILGADAGGHWYYASKAAAMRAYLPRRRYRHVLDVGAGSAFFSRDLLMAGMAEEATCVDPGYPAERDEAVAGRPLRFRRSVEANDADLVLMMDVLEHVPDDVALLVRYAGLAPPGADFFISVPAFAFLWSPHDEFLGHYRRYTTRMLRRTVEEAGLTIVDLSYGFGLVFPLAAARRLAQRHAAAGKAPQSDLKRHSAPVNAGLKLVCAAERPFQKSNRIAGLSVFCAARKGV